MRKTNNTSYGFMYRELKSAAVNMRKNPTLAESKMWTCLRGRRLGVKFRRQHVIDNFIVDFCCLQKSLIVEIDGSVHDSQKGRDKERERYLVDLGFRILRFRNDDVINKIRAVIQRIKSVLSSQ